METHNLPETLALEIRRVTEIREQYRALDGMPGVNVGPVLALTERALTSACVAAGSDNIGDMIAAVKDLRGFTE